MDPWVLLWIAICVVLSIVGTWDYGKAHDDMFGNPSDDEQKGEP